jgi:ankyrin repeat protein
MWAYCQIVHLRDCLPARIRHALAELPETLDQTYERTLREIKSNWEYAHRLFQCVVVASRPLRVEELAEFLAFNFETRPLPKFQEEFRLEDPVYAVLSTCSSLLSIVNIEGSRVIQFSHFSVKEFLTSTRLAETSDITTRRYHISMTSAHTLTARACLGILLHIDNNITRDGLQTFPLAEYAAKHWIDHAKLEEVMPSVEEGVRILFDPNKPHLAIWVWIYDPVDLWNTYERGERPSYSNGTPLHYAALCGLHSIVKYLITEHSLDINARGIYKESTPLHQASDRGHVQVVRALLEDGADITAKNEDKLTPLHRASRSGQEAVVRILLEQGADAAAWDKNRMTPLHWASSRGHVEATRILLGRSKDAAAQDKNGWTSLHWAAFEGRVAIVHILLEHGVDATIMDKAGRTPLHHSSSEGHLEVTRILFERVLDATARDNNQRTILHRASIGGHAKIVRFLLSHDVDATIRDKKRRIPLHYASKAGYIEVSRILLEYGGGAMVKDYRGHTPMDLAQRNEHLQVIHILEENQDETTSASASTTEDGSIHTSRDRRSSDANDEVDMRTDSEEEDEDLEFIEADGEGYSGARRLRKIKNRPRHAAFGKGSTSMHIHPDAMGDWAGLSAAINGSKSLSLMGKKRQGRIGTPFLHRTPKNFPRATSPSPSKRSSLFPGRSSLMSDLSSTASTMQSLHTARTSFGQPSLVSRVSTISEDDHTSSINRSTDSNAQIVSDVDITETVMIPHVHVMNKRSIARRWVAPTATSGHSANLNRLTGAIAGPAPF